MAVAANGRRRGVKRRAAGVTSAAGASAAREWAVMCLMEGGGRGQLMREEVGEGMGSQRVSEKHALYVTTNGRGGGGECSY